MNKKSFIVLFISLLFFLCSCKSTQINENEVVVPYIDLNYNVENKNYLSIAEVREDCDLLRYIFFNTYGGIFEATERGFNLDATIEEIYKEATSFQSNGKVQKNYFIKTAHDIFKKNLNTKDKHICIGNCLVEKEKVYFSQVYFEKKGNEYFVKYCDSKEENVPVGAKYTGPEERLYKRLTKQGELYSFGICTTNTVKSAYLDLEGQKISVLLKDSKDISTRESWSGCKESKDSVYISLGDCTQVTSVSNSAFLSEAFWSEYLGQVSQKTKGKKNIIFDLRSNYGGQRFYPARILRSAIYNECIDEKMQKDLEALMINITSQDCIGLVSPVTEALNKKWLETSGSNEFSKFPEETQIFYKEYWKKMQRSPRRIVRPMQTFATDLETLPDPDFKGDIYILLNTVSASAAEFGTLMAYEFRDKGINVHLIGENSCGAFKYAGMVSMKLKHSGLYLYLGHWYGEPPLLKEILNWKGESKGFYPDYWATSETLLETLELATKDTELKNVLVGLEKSLL